MLPRQIRKPRLARRMYVAFAVGGRSYVLPTEGVVAVGEVDRVLRLPTADPQRLGVVVHRGRVVALLAASPHEVRSAPRNYLLLPGEGEEIALGVGELIGLKVAYGEDLPDGFELFDRLAVPLPTLATGAGVTR